MRQYKIKRPLADRVVVRRDVDADEVSVNRDDGTTVKLHVPEVAKTKGNTGVVLFIGPGVTEVRPEEHVLFGRYSGTELGDLVVLRQAEVMAVIE